MILKKEFFFHLIIELAKTLNTVIGLDEDSLNSMGNEGRKNVTKKFNVEAMCDSTLREYKKLLNI